MIHQFSRNTDIILFITLKKLEDKILEYRHYQSDKGLHIIVDFFPDDAISIKKVMWWHLYKVKCKSDVSRGVRPVHHQSSLPHPHIARWQQDNMLKTRKSILSLVWNRALERAWKGARKRGEKRAKKKALMGAWQELVRKPEGSWKKA